jgi:hypothetical protein
LIAAHDELMSRQIHISYEDAAGNEVPIEIRSSYFLLGCQQPSTAFWRIPRLKEIGIQVLTILGETDPVIFWGWDDLAILGREIHLLAEHLPTVDFDPEAKASWLANLTYCYHLLCEVAPKDSCPIVSIG